MIFVVFSDGREDQTEDPCRGIRVQTTAKDRSAGDAGERSFCVTSQKFFWER